MYETMSYILLSNDENTFYFVSIRCVNIVTYVQVQNRTQIKINIAIASFYTLCLVICIMCEYDA